MALLGLTLLSLSVGPFLSWSTMDSFAQTPPSGTVQTQESNDQLVELEDAQQRYLSVWDNTTFTSQFDAFIAEGSHSGYGIYREHVPANVFRPGETIVLYVEPVGFGHRLIADASTSDVGDNGTSSPNALYLINMTADIIISDSAGNVLQTLKDLPAESFISHRQNTEFSLTLTLSQEDPFPVGDYLLSYIVHDQVTGESFQLDRMITIDDNAITGALPLPGPVTNDSSNSSQSLIPGQQQ